MSVTSANTADLNAFVTGSDARTGRLGTRVSSATTKANAVAAACDFQHPSTPSVAALGELMTTWKTNRDYVKTVHDELVEANQYDGDGNATVSNASVAQALADAGLTNAPGVVDVDAIALYGDPPYSGFRDDPINMASGNFLLRDGDLEVFGTASVLSVVRTYNSLDQRGGSFGRGWSSILDVTLVVEDQRLTYRAADGSGTTFLRREDGTWTDDHRRHLAVAPHGDGWRVTEGHERSWTFDADGFLVGLTALAAVVAVERSLDRVRLADATSGRWVDHHRDAGGRITSASTSDGRTARYRYDDLGRLIGVARDRGDVTYELDEAGLLLAVTDADGIVVCRNTYDPQGRVLAQVEQHGRETAYEYRSDGVSTVTANDGAPPNVMVHDRRGRMTAMIDGLGNTMRLTYDDQDNLVQLVDRTGATTRFTHDARGNVTRRTDADGRVAAFEWDDLDRLVGEVDRAGRTTRFHYVGEGRQPVRVQHADGTEDLLTFDEATGLPATVADADGVSATLSWNRDGLLEAVVDGLGGRVAFTYDDAGRSIGLDAPDGRSAEVGIDAGGRVLALRTPDGEHAFTYTAAGRMGSARDAVGTLWRYELDGAGDLAAISDDAGELIAYERDLVGQVTASTNAGGARATYEHDPVGRLVATVDPLGHRTAADYDAEGRVTSSVDPSGRRTSRTFDVLGQPVEDRQPGGGRTTRTFHPNGQLASETDPSGATWTYQLDAMDRLASVTDPLGGTTTFAYTPAGRLAEERSPLGRTIRHEYDAAGRLSRLIEPDGTEVTFTRRADGAATEIRRNGEVTTFSYDESGRTSAVLGPWVRAEERRTGGLRSDVGPVDGPSSHFDHDGRGLLQRVVDPAGIVTEFTHDLCGQLVAQTTGATTTTFERDAVGRMTAATDPYGHQTLLGRDQRGLVERITLPDGTGTSRTFDDDGRLLGTYDLDGNELVVAVRDATGALTAVRTEGGDLTAEQDALGRLVALGTAAGTVRYAWDADSSLVGLADEAHAITIERDAGAGVVAFELDGATRVEAPSPVEVERDDLRRIVADEHGRTFRYDLAGRLAGTTTAAGATTAFEYDDRGHLATEHRPEGVRTYRHGLAGELLTRRDEDGGETHFTYDLLGRRTTAEEADGSRTAYTWDAFGRLVGTVRTAADGTEIRHRIERDPLGRPMRVDGTPILWDGAATSGLLGIGDERYVWSGNQVRVITDAEGRWDRRVGEDPWGHDGEQGVRLGYRGELALDDLLLLGDRVYDTRNRTFLSRDPLPSEPGRLNFAGVYCYAWNDPVNLVDPTGRRPLSDQEYQAWKDANTKGWVQKNWKTIAKVAIIVTSVAVMAVATATLGPVGLIIAGGVVGALQNGATTAIDGGDWGDIGRSALIGGVFGAASGGLNRLIPASTLTNGLSRFAQNFGRNALAEYPLAGVQEAVDSYMPGGDGRYDVSQALINGTAGSAAGSLGEEIKVRDLFNQNTAPGPTPPPPAPGPNPVPDVSTVASQLRSVNGIGDVLSQRVAAARVANGGPLDQAQLLAIDGIGPVRAQAILDAGLN